MSRYTKAPISFFPMRCFYCSVVLNPARIRVEDAHKRHNHTKQCNTRSLSCQVQRYYPLLPTYSLYDGVLPTNKQYLQVRWYEEILYPGSSPGALPNGRDS